MSLGYRFHPLAAEQQVRIWRDTFERWGEAQADRYIDGLHAALARVAGDRGWPGVRSVPAAAAPNVKFFHYGRHYVFFREEEPTAGGLLLVLTILHDRMDIPRRLGEELRRL
ncbi:MAG: type II toxin-antitoxin system RelE/ParE family toxin [Thiotrichales bacterium]